MLTDSLLRAWWSHRQGLDGSLTGKEAAEVLAASGWARSVGGIGPYLTLFSRAGISREAADSAVAGVSICELPSTRGCTYVLPAEDFALGLKLGQPFGGPEMNTARKLGVTDQEIDRLCDAILGVLQKDALDPAVLKHLVGPAARSLGEAGKKKGVTTTLPLALGRLQAEGEIRRVPVNGRLDQQRYLYVRWSPNPLRRFKLTYEQCVTELAARYFRWAGPATLAEFQWFSALSQKVCKAAMEPLRLVPLDEGSPRLMHPADLDALKSFKPLKEVQYVLVSSLDGISLLRRDLKSLLDAADLERRVPVEKGERALGGLADLESHAILDRGRLVGIWEYDPEAARIVWSAFVKSNGALKEAVSRTEAYVREQLGDARSFSLDSPKSREPKLKALRAAMG
ncbi:MAG: crosslink repair DNA glycosylase YcaQ family protein [Candidatus Solibacter sp.]